jgi:hypothetical protein
MIPEWPAIPGTGGALASWPASGAPLAAFRLHLVAFAAFFLLTYYNQPLYEQLLLNGPFLHQFQLISTNFSFQILKIVVYNLIALAK